MFGYECLAYLSCEGGKPGAICIEMPSARSWGDRLEAVPNGQQPLPGFTAVAIQTPAMPLVSGPCFLPLMTSWRWVVTRWLHESPPAAARSGCLPRPAHGPDRLDRGADRRGHWLIVVGHTPTHPIVPDPFGEADLVSGATIGGTARFCDQNTWFLLYKKPRQGGTA